jgi:hypothetical protein
MSVIFSKVVAVFQSSAASRWIVVMVVIYVNDYDKEQRSNLFPFCVRIVQVMRPGAS